MGLRLSWQSDPTSGHSLGLRPQEGAQMTAPGGRGLGSVHRDHCSDPNEAEEGLVPWAPSTCWQQLPATSWCRRNWCPRGLRFQTRLKDSLSVLI